MKKYEAEEAIEMLREAIDKRAYYKMLELVSPDDPDILPDWDSVPDSVFEEWDELVDEANELIYDMVDHDTGEFK